jgi:hypothetical protein
MCRRSFRLLPSRRSFFSCSGGRRRQGRLLELASLRDGFAPFDPALDTPHYQLNRSAFAAAQTVVRRGTPQESSTYVVARYRAGHRPRRIRVTSDDRQRL